jgi:hypothetical protein
MDCLFTCITVYPFSGVHAYNTKGRLINCVITQCYNSGIVSSGNALVEVEGSQTKVDGNVTSGGNNYGLYTHDDTSSIIKLLSPLTKDSVSTNNYDGRNYYSTSGAILEVTAFKD